MRNPSLSSTSLDPNSKEAAPQPNPSAILQYCAKRIKGFLLETILFKLYKPSPFTSSYHRSWSKTFLIFSWESFAGKCPPGWYQTCLCHLYFEIWNLWFHFPCQRCVYHYSKIMCYFWISLLVLIKYWQTEIAQFWQNLAAKCVLACSFESFMLFLSLWSKYLTKVVLTIICIARCKNCTKITVGHKSFQLH